MTQASAPPPPAPPRPSGPPAVPPRTSAAPARRASRARARTEISYPAAGLDRRFYAFAIDRFVVWSLYAGAAYLAHRFFFSEDATGAGIGVLVGTVIGLGLISSVLLGVAGLSLGKALTGLRVVREADGTPIGVPAAIARTMLLGAAALPTFMLGIATLAWTAVADAGGSRRGWHDHRTGSVVVDVRPVPVEEEVEEEGPRQIVNLTAMRLMPTPPPSQATRAIPTPARASRATPPPPATPASPASPASPAPQGRPEPPTAPPGTPPAAPPSHAARSPRPSGPPTPPPAERRAPGLPSAPPSAPPRAAPSTPPSGAPSAPAKRWRVTFDTGETFDVEGLALVGRRPEARAGEQVAHLVSLRSSDMSLSKTHAQFQVVPDGALVVMDRGSTNGSVLVRRGVAKPLSAGRPATLLPGDTVRFGDREMSVEQP